MKKFKPIRIVTRLSLLIIIAFADIFSRRTDVYQLKRNWNAVIIGALLVMCCIELVLSAIEFNQKRKERNRDNFKNMPEEDQETQLRRLRFMCARIVFLAFAVLILVIILIPTQIAH